MTAGTELPGAVVKFAPSAFDYGDISAEAVAKLRGIAATIKRTAADTIIVIGNHLNDAKDHLVDHGSFIAWVEQEVGMNKRTAQDYMSAARFVQGKNATVALLPPKALYALAAKSTPPEAVAEVLTYVDRQGAVSTDTVLKLISIEKKKREKDKEQAHRNFKRTRAQRDRVAAREVEAKERQLAERHRARVLAEQIVSTYGIATVNAILKAFHAEIYFEDAVRQLAAPADGRVEPAAEHVAKPTDAANVAPARSPSRRVVPLSQNRIRAVADRAVADQEKKHAAKEAKTSETVAESGIAVGTIDGSAVTTVGDPGPMPSFLKIGSPDCWRNKIAADAVSGNPATGTVHCAPQSVRAEMAGQA
jgi:Protein of unknown function (DUF3102)